MLRYPGSKPMQGGLAPFIDLWHSGYAVHRTVSDEAVFVIAPMVPVDIMAREAKYAYELKGYRIMKVLSGMPVSTTL